MKKILLLLLVLSTFQNSGFAQKQSKLDSLLTYLKTAKEDTSKVLALLYVSGKKQDVGDYAEARKYVDSAFALSQKTGFKKGIAKSYYLSGAIYSYLSDYPKALDNLQKALTISEEAGIKSLTSKILSRIGVVYLYLADYKNALVYYQKALDMDVALKSKEGIANNLGNLGGVYTIGIVDYPKAMDHFKRSMAIFEELGNKIGIERSLLNIGIIYFQTNDNKQASEYYQKTLVLAEELGDKSTINICYNNFASLYVKTGDHAAALQYNNKALALSMELGDKDQIKNAYGNYYMIDSEMNNYKDAFTHHKLFTLYKDSIYNSDNEQKVTQLKMQYVFDKKSAADSVKAGEEKKVISVKLEQEQTKGYALYGGLALLMVFGGFMFNRFKVTQKQNTIIEKQKGIVEEKNREILDSIGYALRIQTAILPPQRLVKQYLDNSFILYKPKDIVAGDFYWMETIDDLVLFAACDCTGHGVPGAMVSVVCHNALNRAVREFGLTQPAAILDKTTEIVTENFSKSDQDIKDGMDISLCALNTKTKKLQWAGANNALWLMQNGTLQETKADKQPIGFVENKKPFTNHQFDLNSGETIYLFTDGFADQFGGERGQKKLTRKRFKDLIISLQNESLQEQGIALDKFITGYRKNVEQIDDILVMGVKI